MGTTVFGTGAMPSVLRGGVERSLFLNGNDVGMVEDARGFLQTRREGDEGMAMTKRVLIYPFRKKDEPVTYLDFVDGLQSMDGLQVSEVHVVLVRWGKTGKIVLSEYYVFVNTKASVERSRTSKVYVASEYTVNGVAPRVLPYDENVMQIVGEEGEQLYPTVQAVEDWDVETQGWMQMV
jgi:hypothetical protein